MTFTKKSLQSHTTRMSFIKGASLFFLGMSCVLFATQAFDITPNTANLVQYIQKIFLTTDGSNQGIGNISLDGTTGNGSFSGTVTANTLSGTTVNGTTVNGITVTANTLSGNIVNGTTVNGTTVNGTTLSGTNIKGNIITGNTFCLEGDYCITTWPTGGTSTPIVGVASVWSTGSASIYYNSGNVGIGSGTPGYKLSVDGTGSFTQGLLVNGKVDIGMPSFSDELNINGFIGINNGIKFYKGNYTGSIVLTNNNLAINPLFYFSGIGSSSDPANTYGNIILATSGGNVGIGTSSPASLLHLSGVNNTGNIRFQNNGFIAAGNNTNQLFLGTSGNVGIGSGTPGYKLSVDGTGKFSGLLSNYIGIKTSTPQANLDTTNGTVNILSEYTGVSLITGVEFYFPQGVRTGLLNTGLNTDSIWYISCPSSGKIDLYGVNSGNSVIPSTNPNHYLDLGVYSIAIGMQSFTYHLKAGTTFMVRNSCVYSLKIGMQMYGKSTISFNTTPELSTRDEQTLPSSMD